MIVSKSMNFLTVSRSALRSSSPLCVQINSLYIKASKLCTVRDAGNNLAPFPVSRNCFLLNHKYYSTQSVDSLDRCAIHYHSRPRNLCQPDKIYIQRISLLHDDEKSKLESNKSKHFALKLSFYNLIACVIMGTGGALYVWGSEKEDESGKPIKDEYSSEPYLMATLLRTYAGAKNYWLSYRDPFRETLLPPPLEYPYIQPKYTLVIEPNGVLLHPEWTFKTGWRFKKRPYVDYFLQNCGPPVFEAVVFTSDSAWSTAGLAESLDPRGNVMHWLFRDATRWIDGARVKDLNYLNRDLSKVIMVEWDRNACKMNPNNCLFLKKYEGEDEDRTLFELAHFLRTIAIQGVDDVREIINHYSKFDDPLAVFRENQRAALELEEEKRKKAKSQSFVSTFTRK